MLQGCAIESSMLGAKRIQDINRKVDVFSKKIASIENMKPIYVRSYLKAAAQIYPLAFKLRKMAEKDDVYGDERILQEINQILKQLIEETNSPEDVFGSLEMPVFNSKDWIVTPPSEEVKRMLEEGSKETIDENWVDEV